MFTRLYDSHCHIYPDMIAPRAVASIDQFYEGLPVKSQDGTTATLLKTGREEGISHFIVHSVATRPQQTAHINEFISVATEAHAINVTAMLMEYKNTNYPDLDPLAEFTLDL